MRSDFATSLTHDCTFLPSIVGRTREPSAPRTVTQDAFSAAVALCVVDPSLIFSERETSALACFATVAAARFDSVGSVSTNSTAAAVEVSPRAASARTSRKGATATVWPTTAGTTSKDVPPDPSRTPASRPVRFVSLTSSRTKASTFCGSVRTTASTGLDPISEVA